jgi:hypothetical protein
VDEFAGRHELGLGSQVRGKKKDPLIEGDKSRKWPFGTCPNFTSQIIQESRSNINPVQHASPVLNPFLHTSDLCTLGHATREPIWGPAANGMFFGNFDGFQHEDIPSNPWAADQWTMPAFPLNLTGQMPQPPGVIHTSYQNAEQGVLPVDVGILGLETVDSETQNSSAALVRSKPTKVLAKPRLRCTHPGCKLTFPRKYELGRHLKNIHNRSNIYCPVYGCNRGTKPFARFDKLREHFRKHNTPG